eukprot:Rhum_TRINITY_DN12946_c2_g1::Rhum_TRINITY_DN12946_c2_g1_i1::g.55634::m.55634
MQDDWGVYPERRGAYMQFGQGGPGRPSASARSPSPRRQQQAAAPGSWQWVWGGSTWSWAWVPGAGTYEPQPAYEQAPAAIAPQQHVSPRKYRGTYQQGPPPPPPPQHPQQQQAYYEQPAYNRASTVSAIPDHHYGSRHTTQRAWARSTSPQYEQYADVAPQSPLTRHRLIPSERPRRGRPAAPHYGNGGAMIDATQHELERLRERIHHLEAERSQQMQGITEDELVEDIDEICFGQGLSIVTETINAEDVSVTANVHGIAVKDVYSDAVIFELDYAVMTKVLFHGGKVIIDTGDYCGPVYFVPDQAPQGVTMARVVAQRAGLPTPCPPSPRRGRSLSPRGVRHHSPDDVHRAVESIHSLIHTMSGDYAEAPPPPPPRGGSPARSPRGASSVTYSPAHVQPPPPPRMGEWAQAAWGGEQAKRAVQPPLSPAEAMSPYQQPPPPSSPPPSRYSQPPPPPGAPPAQHQRSASPPTKGAQPPPPAGAPPQGVRPLVAPQAAPRPLVAPPIERRDASPPPGETVTEPSSRAASPAPPPAAAPAPPVLPAPKVAAAAPPAPKAAPPAPKAAAPAPPAAPPAAPAAPAAAPPAPKAPAPPAPAKTEAPPPPAPKAGGAPPPPAAPKAGAPPPPAPKAGGAPPPPAAPKAGAPPPPAP